MMKSSFSTTISTSSPPHTSNSRSTPSPPKPTSLHFRPIPSEPIDIRSCSRLDYEDESSSESYTNTNGFSTSFPSSFPLSFHEYISFPPPLKSNLHGISLGCYSSFLNSQYEPQSHPNFEKILENIILREDFSSCADWVGELAKRTLTNRVDWENIMLCCHSFDHLLAVLPKKKEAEIATKEFIQRFLQLEHTSTIANSWPIFFRCYGEAKKR
jgi:hypothetical protein